ncbi:DNA ligase D, partial [Lysobacter sp. A3-1-A15]
GRPAWATRARALEGARDWAGPMPQPQLATPRPSAPAGDAWLHELKWDGYRMLADIEEGCVRLRSRNGLDWTGEHPRIVAALEALGLQHGCLDGELIALDREGRSDFAALQRTLSGSATATLRYVVFDLPVLEHVDLARTALVDRKALLDELLATGDAGAVAYSQHIVGHGARVFEASGGQGMEGIVSKAVDAAYTPGRSTTWLKIKHSQADEFVIVGYTAPKGSRRGFGSLLLATYEAGTMRYVGRVGTGFNDALLRRLGDRLRAAQVPGAVLELPAHVPFKTGDVHWVEPAVVVEVAYRGWGKEGLLRHASFMRIRDDKGAGDVGDPAPAVQATISSPDRVVYPGLGLTKQDVADYYRSIAPHLLPEVVNRPLSLLRCPDGASGTCFFQKHRADALGAGVHSTPITGKDGSESAYLFIDDLAGLMDLVQMNTLELHPWGARVGDVEHPDRLVFDLDPGEGVDWKAVIAGARDIRDKLQQAGLTGFVRLSGGKGLHVVVPIQRGPTWAQVRDFCEAFADAMATHQPTRYVATASKAKRNGVIFIDWLRNGRGATSVASWSLRAREQAGVAVPLRWSELGRTRSGADYPMARALQRAARLKGDAWDGWDAATRQTLPTFKQVQ